MLVKYKVIHVVAETKETAWAMVYVVILVGIYNYLAESTQNVLLTLPSDERTMQVAMFIATKKYH